jgi:hypothetical protein
MIGPPAGNGRPILRARFIARRSEMTRSSSPRSGKRIACPCSKPSSDDDAKSAVEQAIRMIAELNVGTVFFHLATVMVIGGMHPGRTSACQSFAITSTKSFSLVFPQWRPRGGPGRSAKGWRRLQGAREPTRARPPPPSGWATTPNPRPIRRTPTPNPRPRASARPPHEAVPPNVAGRVRRQRDRRLRRCGRDADPDLPCLRAAHDAGAKPADGRGVHGGENCAGLPPARVFEAIRVRNR